MGTYACSDIHSHLDVFEKLLETLKKDDVLYIVGDVVDKGPDGIEVLQKVMKDDRCHLICGNHDFMMLEYLKQRRGYPEQLRYTIEDIRTVWKNYNGGGATYNSFYKLPDDEKKAIENYLDSLPVLKNVVVGDKHFILVHAGIPILGQNHTEKDLYVKDFLIENDECFYDWRNGYVWDRVPCYIPNRIVISGHTFVQAYGTDNIIRYEQDSGIWYDIDCGLAMRDKKWSRLAVLSLDTLEVKYFTPDKF